MPELAEVETVRLEILKHLKNRKIREVVADTEDRWLFQFAAVNQIRKSLVGAKIMGAGRKGKYFWLELNRKPWPLFHLGMSGNIAILDPKTGAREKIWGGAKLWSERDRDDRDRLTFCRLMFELDKGFEFAFLDPRRFGRMWLVDDPFQHPRISALGYDPLLNFPNAKELGLKLVKRRVAIKTVLLDQKLFAGVGNWLADEILYQARLSPHRLASGLSAVQVKSLRLAVLKVVRVAVKARANYESFPKTWLFHERWGKSKTAQTSRGEKIVHEEIGGRTSAWVPSRQK